MLGFTQARMCEILECTPKTLRQAEGSDEVRQVFAVTLAAIYYVKAAEDASAAHHELRDAIQEAEDAMDHAVGFMETAVHGATSKGAGA